MERCLVKYRESFTFTLPFHNLDGVVNWDTFAKIPCGLSSALLFPYISYILSKIHSAGPSSTCLPYSCTLLWNPKVHCREKKKKIPSTDPGLSYCNLVHIFATYSSETWFNIVLPAPHNPRVVTREKNSPTVAHACRKSRLKWVVGAWRYNWATRSPGDINMET
jgi:hypothetical protein